MHGCVIGGGNTFSLSWLIANMPGDDSAADDQLGKAPTRQVTMLDRL